MRIMKELNLVKTNFLDGEYSWLNLKSNGMWIVSLTYLTSETPLEASSETQCLLARTMRYFCVRDIFVQKFASSTEEPLGTYSYRTSSRNVRISSHAFFCPRNKLSPKNIALSQLALHPINFWAKYLGLPWCKNRWSFSLILAIVRVRIYFVDFFVFFV